MVDTTQSKPPINWPGIALAVTGVILLPLVLFIGLRLAAALKPDAPKSQAVASAAPSAEPRAPTFAEQVAAAEDLVDVLRLLRPRMRSSSGPEPDLGSEVLVQWSALRLTWQHMAALHSTSYARAKKDPDLETGNYICATGRIVEIHADRRQTAPVYRGLMSFGAAALVSFVAVGSSGDIVETNEARFCGVVTGTWEFPNVSNGFTQTVHLVGMFDLPENRAVPRADLAQPAERP